MQLLQPALYNVQLTPQALGLVARLVRQGVYEEVANLLADIQKQVDAQNFEATQAQIQQQADQVEQQLSGHPVMAAASAAGLKFIGLTDGAPPPDAPAPAADGPKRKQRAAA
jgi:hypothetical protein